MPAASSCPDPAQLRQLALGQAADTEALEAHMAQCPHCGEAVTRLDGVDPLIEAIQARTPAVPPADREVVENLVGRLKVLCPRGPEPATEDAPPTPLAGDTPSPHRIRRPAGGYAFLAPPQAPDEIGRLGPYRVLDVVGRGGMGVVFRADDPRVKRVVALKVLLDGRCADPHYLARFQAEAEAVARLRHPNIVQIHEAGEHEGRPYLVLEHVGGGSLAEHLAGRPQPPRASGELTAALAGAVHHAHERGVVHRDLKPANVLLQRKSTTDDTDDTDAERASHSSSVASVLSVVDLLPRIADFGLAKRLDEEGLTQTGDLLGTPGYMAPELTRGGALGGPAADVYGLGAILYELLTGRPPFRGETVADTLEQVRTLDPVPVRRLQPKLPRDLETVCLKCLEKEPARRYGSAQALADDLGRFLRGEPIRARPVSARERLAKWARRKPALAALVAVSGLSLVALVAGVLVHNAQLRVAVKQANDSADEVRRQQRRADASYRAANETLDQIRQHLQGPVTDSPQVRELVRKLLEDQLAYYEGALGGADDPDPAVRLDTARAHERAAIIQMFLDRKPDALGNLTRAIDLVEALPPAEHESPEAQQFLVGCYSERGWLNEGPRPADAERDQTRALDISERLARAQTDDAERQDALARVEHMLANVLASKRAGRAEEAERHYARAIAIRTALIRDHPADENFQRELGEDYSSRVPLDLARGHRPEAIADCARAEGLLRPLVARHPENVPCTVALAGAYVNWGKALASADPAQGPFAWLSQTVELAEALARLNQAVELAEAAPRRLPDFTEARSRVLEAHGVRAQVNERLGRYADAVKDWDRVVEMDAVPKQWIYRVLRAAALVAAGQHARAAAEAETLEADPAISDDGRWELARVYAQSVPLARADAGLPTAERNALAERYAAAAVALLQKLGRQGFFKDATHAGWLNTDSAWQPLRQREDYRKVLAQLTGGG